MPHQPPRFALIDWLRAFAILLMVIYHFCFDLMSFNFITSATFNSLWMTAIGRSCLCIFMFCVGYSLAITHSQAIQWQKFWKRWLKIAGAAALVSLGTFITHPQHWIFFGILHCIAITSLVVLPFLRFPRIALVTGLIMAIAYIFFDRTLPWIESLPWFNFRRPSLDYIPIFPWMWGALVGIGMHSFNLHQKIQLPYSAKAAWLSNHSLAIYLIHQPILISLVYLLSLTRT